MVVYGGVWCIGVCRCVWWCAVVYSSGWCAVVCMVVYGGVWWCMVVCGGVRWCMVVYGGVWWCKVVCSGVHWCMLMCLCAQNDDGSLQPPANAEDPRATNRTSAHLTQSPLLLKRAATAAARIMAAATRCMVVMLS